MRAIAFLFFWLTLISCEIRIGPGGNSGVFFSTFSIESSNGQGESTFLRGKGSYSLVNGRVGRLGDGSRLYLGRELGKPEESEIYALRRGESIETAIFRQGRVSALEPADREWLEKKLDLQGASIVEAPGIPSENERLDSLRTNLSAENVDWAGLEPKFQDAMFPWAVMPEILQLAQREKISPEDEKGLLGLVDRKEPAFRSRDRERVLDTIVARPNLSATGIGTVLANLDEANYSKRTELALQLLEKSNFDAAAARSMLASIDEIPYDGRAQALGALATRGELCPAEDWLDAVLDEAPYDQRTKLVLDALALASPAGVASSVMAQVPLADAALSRLDDFPYDRRAGILTRCVEAGPARTDAAKLVDRALDHLPYHERRQAIQAMSEHPAMGASVVREAIRRVDDLPYDARDEFLIAAAKREDLAPADQVRIVHETLDAVAYHSRAKVLRALLGNPQCSAEAKDTIWRHRKELPMGQREEIEELFRK